MSYSVKASVQVGNIFQHFQLSKIISSIPWSWVFIVPATWNTKAQTCLTNSEMQSRLSVDTLPLLSDAEAASFACLEELNNIGANKKCLLINWNEAYTEFAEVESSFDKTTRVSFLESKPSNDMDTVQENIQSFMGLGADTGFQFADFTDKSEFTHKLKSELRSVYLEKSGHMSLPLLHNFRQRFSEMSDSRKQEVFGDTAQMRGNKLRIKHEMIAPLVIESLEKTVGYVKEIVSRPENRGVTDIIFFGDFAKYPIVVDILKSKLNISIHVADDVETVILKGGALFWLSPEIVTSRILRIPGNEDYASNIWTEPKVTAQHLVIAAFDLGTTFSGFAYSIGNNPTEIWANKPWYNGEQLLSLKTPTSVLLKPDKTFHSFGFDAENEYSHLAEENNHENWMLFRRFKMLLHQTKDGLHRETTVEDISGRKMPALTIFSMAIRYLKEQLMETLLSSKAGISESDIMYVITVPAIWSDGAKQFMKEAAIEAGIDGKQIGLALEPEVAAIWCRHIQIDVKNELLKPGTRFMVVDVGGGTADVSVQEITPNARLKEIHRPDGGAWGGTNVDNEFFNWIESIFGQKELHNLKKKQICEFFDMVKEFEYKKRNIRNKNVFIQIPFSLREDAIKIENQIENLGLSTQVKLIKDKIQIGADVAKGWFSATINNITLLVKTILEEPHLDNVHLVIMVGGFSECKLLQSAMNDVSPNVRVLIPEDAGIAVLKGAVVFAREPRVITSRVMQCSYGINKPVEYDAKEHDCSKAVIENGKKVVHLFEQFVKINDEVRIGEEIVKGFKPTSLNETRLDIYSSPHPNPRYISDRGCTKIGEIIVKHESGKTMDEKIFDVLFEFGKTEVFVRVILRISGEQFGTKLDCLEAEGKTKPVSGSYLNSDETKIK
ncbi:heat shock 70 kDa protein 12A-like isoform X2 [Mya arenaria]|uniref:heat shock 70 kDa protein 12A-like isoform X2 n=1 Tax=Mya arenaria TaxID=6604 RepID=UPI0022E12879|nr:heat shock 70 kDa protein 12A-like isoform X2 [Mya arenaria]